MKKEKNAGREQTLPGLEEIEEALEEEKYKLRYRGAVRASITTMLLVLAVVLLAATLLLPVIRIYGSSMEPTIAGNSIIVCRKTKLPERGTVLAFYYRNKILVRRVAAVPGDEVMIDEAGKVTVNGETPEAYLNGSQTFPAKDVKYPFTVPEGSYFVLADQGMDTVDSRFEDFGCIQEEDFIGKVIFCIYPFDHFGMVH